MIIINLNKEEYILIKVIRRRMSKRGKRREGSMLEFPLLIQNDVTSTPLPDTRVNTVTKHLLPPYPQFPSIP